MVLTTFSEMAKTGTYFLVELQDFLTVQPLLLKIIPRIVLFAHVGFQKPQSPAISVSSKLCACARTHSFQRLRTRINLVRTDTYDVSKKVRHTKICAHTDYKKRTLPAMCYQYQHSQLLLQNLFNFHITSSTDSINGILCLSLTYFVIATAFTFNISCMLSNQFSWIKIFASRHDPCSSFWKFNS